MYSWRVKLFLHFLNSNQTMTEPKLTLHWLNQSRALRIAWLLEELGLDYEIKPYKRDAEIRAPKELADVHSLGKSPVLEVEYPDGARKTVAESGHIVSFLTRNFDKNNVFKPTSEQEFDDVEYYSLMSEGTLQPALSFIVVLRRGGEKAPWAMKSVIRTYNDKVMEAFNFPETLKCFDLLEKRLVEKSKKSTELYIAGERLSSADILLSFPVVEQVVFGDKLGSAFNKEEYPQLVTWAKQIRARPAYIRAQEKTKKFG